MKPKAILLGVVTWFNLSLIFGGLTFFLVRHLSAEQRDTFITPIVIRIVGFIAGVTTGFLAGYVAGRVAKSAELTQAAAVGAVIAVLGFAFTLWMARRHPRPVGYLLVLRMFDFAAAVFGGRLANWRNEQVMANPALPPTPRSRRG